MIRRVFNSNLVPLALFSYSSYQLFLKPAFNLGAGVYNHSSDQGLISHSAMGNAVMLLLQGRLMELGRSLQINSQKKDSTLS